MTLSGRLIAAAVAVVLLAGCAAGKSSPSQPAPAQAAATVPAAPCASFHCAPGDTLPLSGGFQARLWSSPPPAAGDRSVPVVELLQHNAHVAWWTGRLGTGWSAQLTCLASTCVVASALGAHGGAVETLLLADGGFTAPATASVEFDSGTPIVKDLNGDGSLDVIGVENDYRPNFAQGHNYWATYQLIGSHLIRTGCAKVAASPAAPRTLLTGACPVTPNG